MTRSQYIDAIETSIARLEMSLSRLWCAYGLAGESRRVEITLQIATANQLLDLAWKRRSAAQRARALEVTQSPY